MKNWLAILPWGLCLLLLCYIGLFTHTGKCKQELIVKDSIRYVQVVKTVTVKGDTVYSPKPYETIKHDTTFKDVDSARIISNYVTENRYKLPINDSIGKVDVFLTVQYNAIKEWTYKGKFKTYHDSVITIKTITVPKRNKLMAGLILSGNKEYFGASPSLMLKTKKDNSFLIGYDVINKNYHFGAFVGIGKR